MTNSKNNERIIVIDNPEVINGDIYTGEIVSVHNGYVFIHNVKRGYESIGTNGDVFCPVPEDSKFKVEQLVQFFELNHDHGRAGKFRTEKIILIQTGLSLNTPEGRSEAIAKLSKVETPYHRLKKAIDEKDIEKALENKPLAEFIQQLDWLLNQATEEQKPEDIIRLTEDFIEKNFSMLYPLEVKFSILDDVDKDAEKKKIDETIVLYNQNGLAGQSDSLKSEYSQFLKVREAFTLMQKNGLLNYCSVIDIKHLPEFTMAFPVWFVHSNTVLSDQTQAEDPTPDKAVQFFSDSIGSQEYAWLYQIYNRRTRPMHQFKGKDIMPPSLVKVLNQAKQLFDFVTIMTPYHDMASKEWSDANWLRNIDPIMVGFLNGLPQMFILGRWSGTGVFPLLLDCIADTSNHLRINKHLLKNFAYNSYWYQGKDDGILSKNLENGLEKFADKLLLSYENGLLFPFLRGEMKDNPEYKF